MMDGLKIAAVVWPAPAVLIGILLLRNENMGRSMETAIYLLLTVAFVVAGFILLSRHFSEPPDLNHPD